MASIGFSSRATSSAPTLASAVRQRSASRIGVTRGSKPTRSPLPTFSASHSIAGGFLKCRQVMTEASVSAGACSV